MSSLFSLFIKGQKGNYIGGSINFGSNSIYNMMGIAMQARLMNHIDLDLGGSMSFFYGFGYSGGINIVPFDNKFQPFIGCQYHKSFGGVIDFTAKGDDVGYYDISPIEFLYLKSGLMIKVPSHKEDGIKYNHLFIAFTLSYRKPISNYSIDHISGTKHQNESALNSSMSNGIGFNFATIILFGK